MKKRLILTILAILLLFTITSCQPTGKAPFYPWQEPTIYNLLDNIATNSSIAAEYRFIVPDNASTSLISAVVKLAAAAAVIAFVTFNCVRAMSWVQELERFMNICAVTIK